MNRFILKSKIHRATVTHADVHYEGSLTVDETLLNAADIFAHEQVHVWNVTRGTRLQTYALVGEKNSGVICANGAAAHLIRPGDLIIITTFTMMDDVQARRYQPRIIFVDEYNRIRELPGQEGKEIAGPDRREAQRS